MQLGYFHVIAEPVSTCVQDSFALCPRHSPRLVTKLYMPPRPFLSPAYQFCTVEYFTSAPYELSLFFTIFVFLQFWNLFNARAYATGRSALHFKGNAGFTFIVLAILVGQIAIVELGREFFNVVPLKFTDWVIIIGSTSLVLWVGELLRLFSRRK